MIVTINYLEKSGATLDFMFQNPFHIMRKFNEAIDQIQRDEIKQLNREGLMEIQVVYPPMRSCRPSRMIFAVFGSSGMGVRISLLVAARGYGATDAYRVAERVAEIGLLNALGATRTRIRLLFPLKSTLLSTLGGLAGLAIGTLIATLLKIVVSGPPISIPWNIVLGALALSVVIDLAAGVVPAIRTSRLNPIDALRTG